MLKRQLNKKKFLNNNIIFTISHLKRIDNLKDLYYLANSENEEEIKEDCNRKIEEISKNLKRNEINCFLSGKMMI